ncbi:MAG: hypothetical protein HC853_09900 [Anaerolineae bacterium]|nr:hypothetical protein [Anaerolineae bacterium]
MEDCAAANNIPIQHAVFASFGSDGRSFMQADVPSAMIVFPARYTPQPIRDGAFGRHRKDGGLAVRVCHADQNLIQTGLGKLSS